MTPNYNHEHLIHRIGWLRAATLGANDGIISISSLLVGMASTGASFSVIMASGVAGLVAAGCAFCENRSAAPIAVPVRASEA